MKDDVISRQAAIDALRDAENHAFNSYYRGLIKAHKIIANLPPADVQPVRKTAEWIYGEKDGADGWYCSKCGFHIPWYYGYYGLNNINFIKDFHTCPHCDAKMVKYTGMDGEQA